MTSAPWRALSAAPSAPDEQPTSRMRRAVAGTRSCTSGRGFSYVKTRAARTASASAALIGGTLSRVRPVDLTTLLRARVPQATSELRRRWLLATNRDCTLDIDPSVYFGP